MKITILAIGKLKERYWKDAIVEYSKRLSRYTSIEIVEIKEEMCSDNPSPAIVEQVKFKEGERILAKVKNDSYVVVMDLSGKEMSSIDFADTFPVLKNNGYSNFTFIIGGSYGLSSDVIKRGDLIFSMSRLTFPHQLARVILLEQIYRAMKINNGEVYHK